MRIIAGFAGISFIVQGGRRSRWFTILLMEVT